MIQFRTFLNRFRSLGQRRAVKQEIDEELRFHLEQRTAENIASGMTPGEAAREARKRFGNLQSVREECRELRGATFGETTLQDVRFGLRKLSKSPGFASVAVLTLALGIGANTAIFSVINNVLLRPLPYHDPDRLVTVSESNPKLGYPQITVTPGMLRLWREQNSEFAELGGEIYQSLNMTGGEKPEHVHAASTTPNFFTVFGVPPLLGRTFVASDKPPGGNRVVVLSYGLWQRSFAGNRDVIGKAITLSGMTYAVVGVMPKEFRIFNPPAIFGLPTGNVQPQLWTPYPGSMDEMGAHFFLGFGRLKAGVPLARAQAELTALSWRLRTDSPAQKDWGASVQPLKEQIVSGARPALRLLLAAVGFVLLIACANVANLSLARSAARGNEFAVRAALGADRSRLIRQLLVESAILAVLGGALGVLLARASLAGLVALQPANLPRLDEIQLDKTVLFFTLAISVATALLFGLVPALQASQPDFNASLKDNGRSSSEGVRRKTARGVLVVAEVALAMILMAGAGLMISSFARLIRVAPGFAPEQLTTFDFSPDVGDYTDPLKRGMLSQRIRDKVRALPGVKSVATVYGLPFGTMLNSLCGSWIEGRPTTDPRERATAAWRVVSPGYFKTMNVPVVAGRGFSQETDTANSPPVVAINQAFARKYFAGENPVGKRIQVFTVSSNWNEIVGVVEDVKLTGLNAPTAPEIYQPDSQQAPWMFSLVVRSSLPARQIESFVRTEVSALDKGLVPFNVRTMARAISGSVAPQRFTTILIGLFAALALTLTVVGIYGVVSYSVSQQTREFGIRLALGASRWSVLSLVLRQGMVLAAAGICIGLAGSFALTSLIAAQLFEIKANDPVNFAVVALLLALVTLTACYLPARRAAKVDPLVALRYE
jgi:putative ABC transport system permease protein